MTKIFVACYVRVVFGCNEIEFVDAHIGSKLSFHMLITHLETCFLQHFCAMSK